MTGSYYQPPHVRLKDLESAHQKDLRVDPLSCPQCGDEMRIIRLINDLDVIQKILERTGLWKQVSAPHGENRKHMTVRATDLDVSIAQHP